MCPTLVYSGCVSTDTCPVTGHDRLPPGPRLPRLAQMLLVWGGRVTALRRWHARYGEMFTVREPVGGTVVVMSNPEHIRAVFAGDVEVFRAGEGNRVLATVLGERSVLVLDGAEHRDRRRLMMPAFHGEQVRRQEPMMREVIAA